MQTETRVASPEPSHPRPPGWPRARSGRGRWRSGPAASWGAWCDDAAYGARGRPGSSPAQLAMVTVPQFTENLTGRQATDAVRVGAD